MQTVISLTTIPSRINLTEPVIEVLKQQGIPVYLWIPRYCNKLDIEFDGKVPDFCTGINVEVVEDLGPATKLLYSLKAGFDRIITVDDDQMYYPELAKDFIRYSEELSDCALFGVGRMIKGKRPNRKMGPIVTSVKNQRFAVPFVFNISIPTEVQLGEGCKGALYKKEFFDNSIFDDCKRYYYGDDIAFSVHLARKGIKRMVIPTTIHPLVIDKINRTNPLWDRNGTFGNYEMLKDGAFDILKAR